MSNKFEKSEIGAQSAWKGFYSQTLYIASRLAKETKDYKYYPEDIEDLIIRDGDKVVEAVQIKNISKPLTLSSLAGTDTSKHSEGFFNRICSIHCKNPDFNKVRVVYFGSIGPELEGIENGNAESKKSMTLGQSPEGMTNSKRAGENTGSWYILKVVKIFIVIVVNRYINIYDKRLQMIG